MSYKRYIDKYHWALNMGYSDREAEAMAEDDWEDARIEEARLRKAEDEHYQQLADEYHESLNKEHERYLQEKKLKELVTSNQYYIVPTGLYGVFNDSIDIYKTMYGDYYTDGGEILGNINLSKKIKENDDKALEKIFNDCGVSYEENEICLTMDDLDKAKEIFVNVIEQIYKYFGLELEKDNENLQ